MSRSRSLSKRHKTWLWILTWLCTPLLLFAEGPDPSPKETIKQGTLVEPTHGPLVVLADGGLLVAQPIGLIAVDKKKPGSKREILLDSRLFGKIQLPADRVAGIVFHPPPGVEARDAAVAKLLGNWTADRITLVNGDRLDGPLLDIKDRQISVETPFGQTDLKLDRVTSITFATTGQKKKKTPQNKASFFTGWSDGSRLPVAKMTKTRQKQLQVWPYATTTKPWTSPADKLRFLQPLSPKETVYLSDLTPSEYLHTPFLDHKLPLGTDRNVLGHPLRAGGVLYPKGLGTASRSKLVYTLDKPFSRFEAKLAIDDSTNGRGSVIFRVLLDGKPVYTSPVIRGGQKPIPISIDTTDAKQLELEVDYADGADQLDRADWLDARLKKRGQRTENR